ncbi:MAG TPA: alanine--tRNA ligase, partial [Puia sp.]|nr:alanine--tRNA ligase [Puia sp.]
LGGKKDNFWEMGDTGPCGPCTEMHVDCRSDDQRKLVDGKTLVNAEHPQVIEIWNNVFIQFNRLKDGSLEPLPAKHVDTGMGLERVVRVIQNKQSNYDTDLFTGMIAAIKRLTGNTNELDYAEPSSKKNIAVRVIADHIRAISFTIADGQLPSNVGAGYEVRRILRRAVRYYYSYLNYKNPLLYQLVPLLASQFEKVFPEIQQQVDFVSKVVKEEEEAFFRTLERGLGKMDGLISEALTGPKKKYTIAGKDAFELYDTFGFPFDLTKLIAGENNLLVDKSGFDEEMQKQKTRSRSASSMDTEDWVVLLDNVQTKFIGYDCLEAQAKVIKYRKVKSKEGALYHMVLDTTPFYAESGGQVGDTGELIFPEDSVQIIDTKKENDLIIHVAELMPADISAPALAKVDVTERRSTAIHHSATHLLHAALRQVLGTHVAQKGSLVNDEHLRFDFSHFVKVTDEQITRIERLVNEKIRANIPVVITQMPKQEALKLGAMALFGEKYGDMVRVVIIDPNYSVELCGGTHVGATGELGFLKILHESAVAAGVRRIEAVSGKVAEEYIDEQLAMINLVRESLKNPRDINKSIDNLLSENGELKKHIEHLEARQLVVVRNELLQKDEIINQINFIGSIIEVSSADALKKLCFDLKNHLRDYVVVLCSNIGGKPFVALSIAENVAAATGLDANKIIKEHISPLIKGGGG